MGHSPECPKLESSSLIINKKARYISSSYMEKIEGCKKTKDRKEALKEVGLTVSPSTINRVQKFKSSPSCHQDEGCSLLRNLFEFVSHDTHDGSYGGRSVIEKDQENRLVRAFLAPPACCATAKHFLPQIVLDGTFSKGCRGGTFLTACMQDGNTETVVVCIAFVPTEAKEHWLWFCRSLRESLNLDWNTTISCQIEEKALFLL